MGGYPHQGRGNTPSPSWPAFLSTFHPNFFCSKRHARSRSHQHDLHTELPHQPRRSCCTVLKPTAHIPSSNVALGVVVARALPEHRHAMAADPWAPETAPCFQSRRPRAKHTRKAMMHGQSQSYPTRWVFCWAYARKERVDGGVGWGCGRRRDSSHLKACRCGIRPGEPDRSCRHRRGHLHGRSGSRCGVRFPSACVDACTSRFLRLQAPP